MAGSPGVEPVGSYDNSTVRDDISQSYDGGLVLGDRNCKLELARSKHGASQIMVPCTQSRTDCDGIHDSRQL